MIAKKSTTKKDRAAWHRRLAVEDKLDAKHARKVRVLIKLHRDKAINLQAPTKYAPGSAWKIAVIAARHKIGLLQLHVAGDVNHNEACLIHCTTLPLDRPTYAACRILEVLE